jgi:hypothetical protein
MRFTSRGIGFLIVCVGSAAASAAPITSFTYTYDNTVDQPSPLYPDTSGAELNDNAFINPFLLYNDPGWVGTQDAGYPTPPDSGAAQPRVNLTFDAAYNFNSLTVTYLVDQPDLVYAPDQLTLEFSDDGISYGAPQVFTAFLSNPNTINTATIPLAGQSGRYVRASFFNDEKWTFLGELDFEGTLVPEPASAAILGLGGALVLRRRRG